MISIIIIVKNDPRVHDTLSQLAVIKKPEKTEIIVVDASNPQLKRPDHTEDIRWITYRPTSSKATYPEQRNIGLQAAGGSIVAFIDADCTPAPDWLINLTQPIRDGKESITAGQSISRPAGYMQLGEIAHGGYLDECASMNMAISKEVVDSVGYFDETFEKAEDSDFCLRARAAGYKIKSCPTAIIYHDWGNFAYNLRRSYYTGQARTKLYKKHPRELLPPHCYSNRKNAYSIIYTTYVLLLPISLIFPEYLLLLFLPSLIFRRNPIKEIVNFVYGLGMLKALIFPWSLR